MKLTSFFYMKLFMKMVGNFSGKRRRTASCWYHLESSDLIKKSLPYSDSAKLSVMHMIETPSQKL